jgi:hypothetical protein
MIQNSTALDRADRHPDARERQRQRKLHVERHKHFQFIFAITTVHELCHVFFGYISGNGRFGEVGTPPEITHLDYGENSWIEEENEDLTGESGRWVENFLFGGSLEYILNERQAHGQVSQVDASSQWSPTNTRHQTGIPYLVDSNGLARRVDARSILLYVEGNRRET